MFFRKTPYISKCVCVNLEQAFPIHSANKQYLNSLRRQLLVLCGCHNYNRISLCLQVFYNLFEIIVILFLHRFIAWPYLYIKLKFKNHQTGYFPQPLKYAILLPAFYAWYHNESFDYALEQQYAFQHSAPIANDAKAQKLLLVTQQLSKKMKARFRPRRVGVAKLVSWLTEIIGNYWSYWDNRFISKIFTTSFV